MTLRNYDADGNVVTRMDGRGIVTTYGYSDPESLLTDVSYSDSTPSVTDGTRGLGSTPGVSYAYDDDDLPQSVVTNFLNPAGTGLLPAQTLSYAYAPDGRRLTMTTPAGPFASYYDPDGRDSDLADPLGETARLTYGGNSWLTEQTLDDGLNEDFAYNRRGWQTDMSSGGRARTDFGSIGYDGAGNRTGMTTTIPAFGSIPALSGTTADTYDYGLSASSSASLRRGYLTQEVFTPTGGSASTLSFGYDGHTPSSLPTDPTAGPGNPTVMRGTGHSFNADNQDTGNGYDGNGNPTFYGGNSLTFDAENRLTSYGSALTNGYDGDDGLRAWKQTSSGTRTYFLYDGGVPVCELNASGSVTAFNVWGPTGLLSRNTGGSSVFYTFDPSGNLAQRLDIFANVLASIRFDAFGDKSGTDASPDPYSGFGAGGLLHRQRDRPATAGHRFYGPAAGRFVNRDLIGYAGGINLYGYVDNDPVDRDDPAGN